MNPAEVEWSRRHFDLLSINAIWGIPRSGLVFKKVSQVELALDDVMPWSDKIRQGFQKWKDVPPTAEKLRLYQRADFETIAKRFTAAGVIVTDPKQLLKD